MTGPAHAADAAVSSTSIPCAELRELEIPAGQIRLPTRGARITSAVEVTLGAPSTDSVYCKVDGEIVSVDAAAQPIRFSIALPREWNGKTLQLGGGGFNGIVVSPTSMPGHGLGGGLLPVVQGYVVVGSDSGHASSPVDASFMLNDEELRNFASDQIAKTRDVALAVVQARYRAMPKLSYYIGGSEGGREALAAVQDFPDDYDGAISLYPFMAPIQSMLKATRMTRAMMAHNGAGWLSETKLGLVRNWVLQKCDAIDGKTDKLVNLPDTCRVSFSPLRCPRGADTGPSCLSDAELRTLNVMQGNDRLPYKLANDLSSLPGFMLGADWGIGGFSSSNTTVPPSVEKMGINHALPQAMVRNLVYRNAQADVSGFDPLRPGKHLADVKRMSALLDKTNPDLDRFVRHGGKLMLIHGLADIQTNPATTIAYYHALAGRYGRGKLARFARLYLVPGWGHGRGISFNASNVPLVDVLDAWVRGVSAPGTITVQNQGGSSSTSDLPLCPYPASPMFRPPSDLPVPNDAGPASPGTGWFPVAPAGGAFPWVCRPARPARLRRRRRT